MGSSYMTVNLEDDGAFEAYLKRLDAQVAPRAVKKALRKAGNVVAKRARQKVPRSASTGTTKLHSRETAAQRAGEKPLHKTIGVVVRSYGGFFAANGAMFIAYVGPMYPAGALGHLIEYGHELYAWGVPTGQRVAPQPFMRPSAEETQAEQTQVIIATLQAELENV